MDVHQFDLHARLEDDHWWFTARREIIFSVLKRFLPPGAGTLVAEIGCGTGGNLKFLQQHYRVMGVDTSPEAVAYCAERVSCPVLRGDFREQLAPYWPEIDAVLLADVLEHIDDDGSFLADIVASLNFGGVVLVTVPAHESLWTRHDVVLGHVRRYAARQLHQLWRDLPVEELFFSPFNSFLFPAIAASRKISSFTAESSGDEGDLRPCHPVVNGVLRSIFAAERFWLELLPLPFGVSYLAVLRKNSAGGT